MGKFDSATYLSTWINSSTVRKEKYVHIKMEIIVRLRIDIVNKVQTIVAYFVHNYLIFGTVVRAALLWS